MGPSSLLSRTARGDHLRSYSSLLIFLLRSSPGALSLLFERRKGGHHLTRFSLRSSRWVESGHPLSPYREAGCGRPLFYLERQGVAILSLNLETEGGHLLPSSRGGGGWPFTPCVSKRQGVAIFSLI